MALYHLNALTAFLALAPHSLYLGAEAKHDGRSHKHIEARQIVNDPATGLGFISSHSSSNPNLLHPTSTSPAASIVLASIASGPITISTFVIATTVIQIPIATVCPDMPPTSVAFPLVSAELARFISTRLNNTAYHNATDYLPIPTHSQTIYPLNATAFLANGSTTTFRSYTTSTITVMSATSTPDSTARIIFDTNGCQTLYSPTTTVFCSTTLSIGGQLPIPVTECSQLVTFSTSAGAACATGTAVVTGQALGAVTAYFVAPWHEIAAGKVPHLVQVVSCVSGMGGSSCTTDNESWSVSTETSESVVIGTVGFTGAAILTHSGQTITTTLSIDATTTTTTSTMFISTIIREKLATPVESTVTVVMTMPTVTKTLQLDQVVHTTTTMWETAFVTATATVTSRVDAG